MAELKIPNLCGASPEFNAIQDKFESLINSAIDGLDSSASSLASTVGTDITSLETELRALVPTLPALPNVNLQSQLTSLSSLTSGSFAHTQLLSDITTDFGTELSASGYTLDTLVTNALSKIQGGGDLCSAVPNFEMPADGLTAAIEKAVESKQATTDSVEEKPSTVVRNANFTADKAANETRVASMQVEGESEDADVVKGTVTSTTPPTEDTGAYKVTTESSKVTYEGSEIKVTTPATQDGKNVTDTGFTKKKSKLRENFKLADAELSSIIRGGISSGDIWTLKLKHIPLVGTVGVSGNFLKTFDPDFNEAPERRRQAWLNKYGKDPVQNFYRIPKNESGSRLPGHWRFNGHFIVGNDVARAGPDADPRTIIVHSEGIKYTPHTKELEFNYDDELEGLMFIVNYSYFPNYDPDLVET